MDCNLSVFSGKPLQHKTHAKKLPGRSRRQTRTLNTQQHTVSQYHTYIASLPNQSKRIECILFTCNGGETYAKNFICNNMSLYEI